jgi:hypothetical protein
VSLVAGRIRRTFVSDRHDQVSTPAVRLDPVDPDKIDWAQAQMSSCLQRQNEVFDSLDVKTGVIATYAIALVAAAASIGANSFPANACMYGVIFFALAALICCYVGLRVRDFHVAPSAESINIHVRGGQMTMSALRVSLMEEQLEDIRRNGPTLERKAEMLSNSFWLVGIATVLIATQFVIRGA